ncbi:hypothetical protein [uncultured Methanocorpusculum sp.]|nr:hypothetical protein [uncultured Methanocorpusculum sp.]
MICVLEAKKRILNEGTKPKSVLLARGIEICGKKKKCRRVVRTRS